MTTLRGAALGLLLLLLNPLAFLAVVICAAVRRYPWFLLTPDDPVSPFGLYEDQVRRVYVRFGRYVGDVYWLGLRNCLYGAAYALKPREMKGLRNYIDIGIGKRSLGRATCWSAGKYRQWTVRIGFGFFLLLGWKVDRVVIDPNTYRASVNMDFRPTFSVRRKVAF